MINDIDFSEVSVLKISYIYLFGTLEDGTNVYRFIFSYNSDDVWGESWEQKPACNCRNLIPDSEMYDSIYELQSDIVLDLAQNNCCFSMQDARDRCVALACENLDQCEMYPENGRIVIQYGQTLDEIQLMLSKRDLFLKEVDNS